MTNKEKFSDNLYRFDGKHGQYHVWIEQIVDAEPNENYVCITCLEYQYLKSNNQIV
jgi:hypothetical protein